MVYKLGYKVLALDQATVYTGWCVMNDKLEIIDCGLIRTENKDIVARIKKIVKELREVIEEHDVDEIAIEDQYYALNANTAKKLSYVAGAIMLMAIEEDIDIYSYYTKKARKVVLGDGNATKDGAREYVYRNYPEVVKKFGNFRKEDDIIDAIIIAIAHIILTGRVKDKNAKSGVQSIYL